MSWLARCLIDVTTAHQQKLHDRYCWHKFIWTFFPNRPDDPRDFLFRVDETPEGNRVHVLSAHEPCRPVCLSEEHWQCKPVPTQFLEHSHYRFDVVCNPGRKLKTFDADGQRKKNSRREAIIHKDEQEAWFLCKAEAAGFALASPLRIDPCENHRFSKNNAAGTHIGVRFCGILAATDKERFCRAYTLGLGSARGFGFGLMLLAPVHHNS